MDVHELKETDPARFEKEYQAWAHDNLGYDWWDDEYEDVKARGKERGFDISDIWFQFSCSHGDGATWEGNVDLREFAKAHGLLADPVWSAVLAVADDGRADSILTIYTQGQRNTMRAESVSVYLSGTIERGAYAGMDAQDLIDAVGGESVFDDIENAVLNAANDFAGDVYRRMVDEYEYRISEESFVEHCDCNEVTFGEE